MAIMIVDEIISNVSPSQKCWRLIHDGLIVITLFESDGETMCIHQMFCATTEAECLTEIKRLGLKYVPEIMNVVGL